MKPTRAAFAFAFASLVLGVMPGVARADYARPPDGYDDRDDRYPRDPFPRSDGDMPRSVVRIFTGPVLRVSDTTARGGLGLALDAGARGAGVRLSSDWVRAGTDRGSSQYGAELWVDFAAEEPLHPILAAGAAIARLDRRTPDGLVSDSVGVGLLRATLQYRLPVAHVDARAGLDVTGAVPAVGAHASDASPWALASITVGVGF